MLSRPQEREEISAITNDFDAAAQEKLVLVKDILKLNEERSRVRKAYTDLCQEFNLKEKSLDSVHKQIQSETLTLSRMKADFEKENAGRIKELNTKLAQVQAADETYRALLIEIDEMKQKLKGELHTISIEREEYLKETERLNRHVKQVEDASIQIKYDVEKREEALAEAKLAFEAEVEEAQLEISRLSEIKNENTLLWQKIEADKAAFESSIKQFEAQRENNSNELAQAKERLKQKESALEAERAKLLKIEEELNDRLLEVKAREAEAAKTMKRYQLTKTVNEAEAPAA